MCQNLLANVKLVDNLKENMDFVVVLLCFGVGYLLGRIAKLEKK